MIPPRYEVIDDGYRLLEPLHYLSVRYGKFISAPKGYKSDGASWAQDIHSVSWWVHDVMCTRGTWDGGIPCTNWQASMVLFDILWDEKRYVRSLYWPIFTWLLGGGKARENGLW